MKISEQLKAAKALIDEPSKWLQGAYSNAENYEAATCFCSLGAIHKVLGNHMGATDRNPVSEALGRVVGSIWCVAEFNDGVEHGDVMDAFDHAIKLAQEKEANEHA